MKVHRRALLILGALLGVVAAPIHRTEGGVTTYTNSTDFAAAILGDSTFVEDYGSLSAGTTIGVGQTVDGITYTAFTPGPSGTLRGGIITDRYSGFTPVSLGGDQSTGDQFFKGGDSVTMTFASPVNAFGIFFNVNVNSGDYGFTTSVGTATTGSDSYDLGTFVFAGLVSTDTPFSSVTFYSTEAIFGSYNVPAIVTAVVPEPSSLLLGTVALAAFVGMRASRRLA
jgi:hypothetical protein